MNENIFFSFHWKGKYFEMQRNDMKTTLQTIEK